METHLQKLVDIINQARREEENLLTDSPKAANDIIKYLTAQGFNNINHERHNKSRGYDHREGKCYLPPPKLQAAKQ